MSEGVKNDLTPENYYDDYPGWSLSLMIERLKLIDLPDEVEEDIRRKERANFLVLGSATTDNLTQVAKMDHRLRPGKAEDDMVTIIDQNFYPLELHQRDIQFLEGKNVWSNKSASTPEFPLPKYCVVQADMREMPMGSESMDVVISDYTLNFLDTLEDVDRTFVEISRVLVPGGMVFLTVRGNDLHETLPEDVGADIPKEYVQDVSLSGVVVHYLPLQAYVSSAKSQGLHIIGTESVGSDVCFVMRKAKVE